MTRKLLGLFFVLFIATMGSAPCRLARSAATDASQQNHEVWLARILQRMDAVKPRMTRADLLEVFRTDGQPSREALVLTGLRRTFISRDCPYFRVEVEFKPAMHPERGAPPTIAANSGGFEDAQDVIVKMSKPYVETPTSN